MFSKIQDMTSLPRVFISTDAWRRMWAYVDEYPLEIGGLGEAHLRGTDIYIPKIVLLPKTTGTLINTDATEGAADLVYQMIQADEDPSVLRFWWHSHGPQQVYWSGDDIETIRSWGDEQASLFVSCVMNHAHEYKLMVTIFHPVMMAIDELRFEVVPEPLSDEERAGIREEIYSKVKGARAVMATRRIVDATRVLFTGGVKWTN